MSAPTPSPQPLRSFTTLIIFRPLGHHNSCAISRHIACFAPLSRHSKCELSRHVFCFAPLVASVLAYFPYTYSFWPPWSPEPLRNCNTFFILRIPGSPQVGVISMHCFQCTSAFCWRDFRCTSFHFTSKLPPRSVVTTMARFRATYSVSLLGRPNPGAIPIHISGGGSPLSPEAIAVGSGLPPSSHMSGYK